MRLSPRTQSRHWQLSPTAETRGCALPIIRAQVRSKSQKLPPPSRSCQAPRRFLPNEFRFRERRSGFRADAIGHLGVARAPLQTNLCAYPLPPPLAIFSPSTALTPLANFCHSDWWTSKCLTPASVSL